MKPPNKVPASVDAYRSQLVQKLQRTHQVAKEQIQLSQQRMKDLYDRDSKPYPYKLGDRVWTFNPAIKPDFSKKLLYRWHGPYRLVEQLSPVRVKTSDNQLLSTPVHVDRLKPYCDPNDRPLDVPVDLDIDFDLLLDENDLPADSFEPSQIQAPPPASQSKDDPLYPIEQVLKRRTGKGIEECFAKRQGFSSTRNSWTSSSSIVDHTKPTETPDPTPHTVSMFSSSFLNLPAFSSTTSLPFHRRTMLPYFLILFCFVAYLGSLSAKPNSGPLYDCSELYDCSSIALNCMIALPLWTILNLQKHLTLLRTL